MNLQDGVKTIWNWRAAEEQTPELASHVVQMIGQGFAASKVLGSALLLLDRYFLSVPALTRWKQEQAAGGVRLDLVTKAKASATAYEFPAAKKQGRGRP
ncbi:transposase, partial [Paenibacillus sp. y28]